MDLKNCTKRFFDKGTEYDLDVLIDPDPGSHPVLVSELPVLILDENTPYQITAMETNTLVPSSIADFSDANRCNTHNTVVCDNNEAPAPILHQSTQHPIFNLIMNMRTTRMMMSNTSTLRMLMRIIVMTLAQLSKDKL